MNSPVFMTRMDTQPTPLENSSIDTSTMLKPLKFSDAANMADILSDNSGRAVAIIDTNNVDSLAAWALLAQFKYVVPSAEHYRRHSDFDLYTKYNEIVVLGVEMEKEHLAVLVTRRVKVTIFAYKDQYQWLKLKGHKWLVEKITVIHPYAEAGIEQLPSDNSIAKMVILLKPELTQSKLAPYVEDIARSINQQPLVKSEKEMDVHESFYGRLEQRATLYDIRESLYAHAHESDREGMLMSYTPQADTIGYTKYYRRIRLDIRDNKRRSLFGKYDSCVIAPVMCVHESQYTDYLYHILMSDQTFVGYHDTTISRVWRVYSQSQANIGVIRTHLKPFAEWTEGVVYCMETEQPRY